MDDEAPTSDTEEAGTSPPVVGVCASADGAETILRLLLHASPDCGLAFVLLGTTDPAGAAIASALAPGKSPLPVTLVEDGQEVEPNHVYLMPPEAGLVLQGNRLHLAPVANRPESPGIIDEFLTSLARDKNENAACVILPGTGSNGTLGLRAIKESGGLAIAQADVTYDGMMRNAIAAGVVDSMLPPHEIAPKLRDYFHLEREARRDDAQQVAGRKAAHSISVIVDLLRARTGHDFSGYKDRTIIRRLQRRMHVLQLPDVDTFIERLRSDPHEVTLLFQDLLIGVTEFFRDREAFVALKEKVIPALFAGKGRNDCIRAWVPACSTGEEAYSIAILLREHAATVAAAPRLQIFASDIDERALETARLGRYPAAVAKDLPPEYLSRYFVREDGTYRIAADLREICLFSPHNILRDAPFSKQDLISCRNLLIYLGAELQAHIIPLFHYALNVNGFLFLGPSENVTRHSRLFATVEKTHRIFQRRSNLDRRLPEFPLSAPDPRHRGALHRRPRYAAEPTLRSVAERQLLDRFSPPYVIVNAEGDLVQTSGGTGRYLELPAGAPDTNVLSMARSGLRLELRAALHRAVSTGQPAMQPKVSVGSNGSRMELDLCVQPLWFGEPPEIFYMVIFRETGFIHSDQAAQLPEPEQDLAGANLRQMEAELRLTRERLQATTEELESSNEELKSSNEELSSMNEELQSANEELETSKEELQSINEELQTVNFELNSRVDELTRTNNDMSNLLDSTQIATVFLNRQLLVKGFTPAAKDVFRLVESDTGRPILHVRPRVEIENLQADAEKVLRTLTSIERPVKSNENGTLYMMRLLPYRTMDNVIDGVVMTFIDITRVAQAEAQVQRLTHDLRARIEELETVIDLVPVGLIIAEDANAERILVNQWGARLFGMKDEQKGLVPLTSDFHLFHGDEKLKQEDWPLNLALRTGEPLPISEARLERADGTSVEVMVSATPLFDGQGAARGAVAAVVDISGHRALEARQRVLLDELQHRVKNTLAAVSSLARRMSQGAKTIDEFQESFLRRLTAMSRTHDLLSGGAWAGADLRSLLQVAIGAHSDPERMNVVLEGEQVVLTPNTATTLGLVFHELSTNAVKYGALMTPQGSVNVSWQIKSSEGREKILQVLWKESEGPAVEPSASEGFGMNFVRSSISYELEGKTDFRFDRAGFHCEIEFPLAGRVE